MEYPRKNALQKNVCSPRNECPVSSGSGNSMRAEGGQRPITCPKPQRLQTHDRILRSSHCSGGEET